MTDTAKFEQFGLHAFYQAIPILDNASDWFKWNEKVNDFIQISPVADDNSMPPIEEEEARQWTHRQNFYSKMITAKLTHNAAQRINAASIHQVQSLLAAVKKGFKPEGSGTYVNLQRQYMSLTREQCGSVQTLGAQIRRIHAEKLLLDQDCVTSEIERTFFFMHALGPEYESFRDHVFRQMDLVNERDPDGNITNAAPSFDYIENKAIEEEHRKTQLGKPAVEAKGFPALALVRGPGDKRVIPSPGGAFCRIEIDNVPYCSFCRNPYHVESECFKRNPELKNQSRDIKGPKVKPGSSRAAGWKPLKRPARGDDEDEDERGPKNPKKATFMATKACPEDVNVAFARNSEANLAVLEHSLAMMAAKTPSIRDAWIVDTGCAQHVCNKRSAFVQMENYRGPSLRSVDGSTPPIGIGTANILCQVRGRRKWLVLDDVLYVPSAHANLLSVLQLIKRGAKIEFSSRGASIRSRSNGKNLYTAVEYHGVYALNLWTNLAFPAYHVSPQMTLWHHRLAHLSDGNLRRLKNQAYGIRDIVPRRPCKPCLQGRILEKPHIRSSRRGEYPMELLHIDAAGPFDEGLDGSRYWVTIVDDATGWIEVTPIPQRKDFVIESLRFFLDHNERPERKCRRIRLDRISEQTGEEMKFVMFSRAIHAEATGVDQHQQNGVAERAHRTIYDRVGPTLAHTGLPYKFWPEIARTAAFLSNRSPSARLNMTPYQAWYGDKPDLSSLRVIGSRGEYMIPPKQRKKLTEPRTKPCVLLGYEGNTNYRILLEDGRIIGTPNAEFSEVLMGTTPSCAKHVGAQSDLLLEAADTAVGESEAVQYLDQTMSNTRQVSVPASGRQISMAPPEQMRPHASDDDSHGRFSTSTSDDNSQVHLNASDDDSEVRLSTSDDDSAAQLHVNYNDSQSSDAGDDDLQTRTHASDDDSRVQSYASDDDSQMQPDAGDDDLQTRTHASDDDSRVQSYGDLHETTYTSNDNSQVQFETSEDGPQTQFNSGTAQRVQAELGRHPELQLDCSTHVVQREALQRHPELRIRATHDPWNSISDSEDQLALMNVSVGNIIPTFLTIAAKETEPFEPRTVQQAQNDASWPEWERAMLEEVNSLKQNKTWELVDPPKDRRVLSGKWVFKLKRGPHGEVIRHKARWVVRGFTQEEGIDYDETFASVVKPMSYKALFAIGAAPDLEIEQMDVRTAFLYGDIDYEIFVEQPYGMTDGTTKVCKLRKALYGLKQAPRIWYQTLTNFLRGLGFEPINADLGIFVRSSMYIAVYVDDLLIVGPSIAEIKRIKRQLRNRFQMSDLGPCTYYLGMLIQRDRQNRILRLSQEAYIDKVISQFGMENCKPVSTPMETSPSVDNQASYVCPPSDRIEYQRVVGSSMYIMLGTRGDIASAVSLASRYLANPGPQHIKLARRIVRYLAGTKGLKLTYKGQLETLKGFTDADWAGCRDTRRSTAGYLFNLGSGAVSWQSKRQSVVALSTCEAEFLGQTQATKEAIWLRRLLDELNVSQGKAATIICGDNQGAIALSSNPQYHSRTKHMSIQRQWQGEVQDAGSIALKYIPTIEQIADGFTKPLARDRFEWFRKGLGIE